MNSIQFPKVISTPEVKSWDEWLANVEHILLHIGYKKYIQNHKKEDFSYWKTFEVNGKKAYQVGLYFYDFRKYAFNESSTNRIGIQFECMFIDIDSRIDLSVSKDIPISEFEDMAKTFYESMKKFSK